MSAALLSLSLLISVTAAPQSWPQFRGPAGDGISQATDLPAFVDRDPQHCLEGNGAGPGTFVTGGAGRLHLDDDGHRARHQADANRARRHASGRARLSGGRLSPPQRRPLALARHPLRDRQAGPGPLAQLSGHADAGGRNGPPVLRFRHLRHRLPGRPDGPDHLEAASARWTSQNGPGSSATLWRKTS